MPEQKHTRRSILGSLVLGSIDLQTPEVARRRQNESKSITLETLIADLEAHAPGYRVTRAQHAIIGPTDAPPPEGLFGVFAAERRLVVPPSASTLERLSVSMSPAERREAESSDRSPDLQMQLFLHPDHPDSGETLRDECYRHIVDVQTDMTTGFEAGHKYSLECTVVQRIHGVDAVITEPPRACVTVRDRELFGIRHIRDTAAGVLAIEADGRGLTAANIQVAESFATQARAILAQYYPHQIDRPDTPNSSRTRLKVGDRGEEP